MSAQNRECVARGTQYQTILDLVTASNLFSSWLVSNTGVNSESTTKNHRRNRDYFRNFKNCEIRPDSIWQPKGDPWSLW